MSENEGWLKLWRKSQNSAVFSDPTTWKLWCLCLMKATHKKCWVPVEGILQPVELQPGQFITGRFALHKDFYPKKKKNNLSPFSLWRRLKLLQDLQNVIIRSHAKYSIITIVNWEHYQQNDQQVINRRSTGDQQVITNKNVKNNKNEKNTPPIPPPKKLIDELKEHLSKKIAGNGLEKYSEKLIEFVEYRMSTKGIDKYKTVRGIDGLIRDSKNCLDAGLNLGDCIDITIERSWLTPDIKYFKEARELAKRKDHKPEYATAPEDWVKRYEKHHG
jgi:hypothetical protein